MFLKCPGPGATSDCHFDSSMKPHIFSDFAPDTAFYFIPSIKDFIAYWPGAGFGLFLFSIMTDSVKVVLGCLSQNPLLGKILDQSS
jgi:hypothetical protein